MRYRKLDANGDYTLGTSNDWLVDSPDAVGQAIKTRLGLWTGEWFVDTTDGMPWNEQVLGKRLPGKTYDMAIRKRILETAGVKELTSYSSAFDGNSRTLSITATVNTIYGATSIAYTLGTN